METEQFIEIDADYYNELKNKSKNELIYIILNKKYKESQYKKKYFKTENGKNKVCEASRNYYNKNRDLILEKKRLKYHDQKKNVNKNE